MDHYIYNYLKQSYQQNGGTKFLRVFLNINKNMFDPPMDGYPTDMKLLPDNYNQSKGIEETLECHRNKKFPEQEKITPVNLNETLDQPRISLSFNSI